MNSLRAAVRRVRGSSSATTCSTSCPCSFSRLALRAASRQKRRSVEILNLLLVGDAVELDVYVPVGGFDGSDNLGV